MREWLQTDRFSVFFRKLPQPACPLTFDSSANPVNMVKSLLTSKKMQKIKDSFII